MRRRRSPQGEAASKRAPAARRTRAKRACPAGGAPSLGAQRQAAGAEPRPSDGRRCSPCRIAGPHEARPPGEARRPPRRTHPRSERSTQRVARQPHSAPRQPRRPSGQSPRPPRRVGPRSDWRGVAGAGAAGARGAAGRGLRATRCVERSERGCVRLGDRGLRPLGASGGERTGMGYTVSHPMDAAARQPLGAARQARALRLQDRLASLASCGPRAPVWTRLRPSGFACGACSLRSRSTGHGPGAESPDGSLPAPPRRVGPAERLPEDTPWLSRHDWD